MLRSGGNIPPDLAKKVIEKRLLLTQREACTGLDRHLYIPMVCLIDLKETVDSDSTTS